MKEFINQKTQVKTGFCLLLLLFMLLHNTVMAQSVPKLSKITLIVKDDKGALVENATVQLLRAKDSSFIKAAITDQGGVADFEKIKPGDYLLKTSSVNLTTTLSDKFSLSEGQEIELTPIVLKSSGELKAVVVTTKRPFIQKLSDRLVVNVDNSVVNAGSSAMEVLERSPGVNIDQNDVISLRGRQGVIIMIDGKISPMTGQDLGNFLRGLPSNAIDRIDIITNPSAKYDASGNSGIIDIHMKKDQKMGANGTFTASYGQGIYPKANTGATFNYRNKKVNVFGNYNYGYRKGLNHLILDRNFYDNSGNFLGEDNKDNYTINPFKSHTARFGVDFFPSKTTTIGFVVNANFNNVNTVSENHSLVIDGNRKPSYNFSSDAFNNAHQDNDVANINLKHSFKNGKELTADIDYGKYTSGALSSTDTKYFNLDGTYKQPAYILNGDQTGYLTLRTGKFDFTNPLKHSGKIDFGGKASYVSSDNDVKYYDASNGTPQNDVNKTNHFLYDEYDYASYLNFSKEYKKFNVQFGLRGEATKVKTNQLHGGIKHDTSYVQLFPSGFINYNVKEDETIGLSVSRRIDRPGYAQLNPFLFLIDVSTYATGNPGLLPQLTWSYELSYTKKSINFTLGYSHTTNDLHIAIARFKDVFPNIPSSDNITVQIPINLASSDYFGLTVAAPVKINKWWNMINNANLYYNHFNGNLGGTTLNNGKPALDASTNNSFSFSKGWGAELNATFSSGGQYGFTVIKPSYGISTGVQKSILKKKGALKLNITDIFWTNLPGGVITYNNYREIWNAYRESRVATLAFTYRFGKTTVQGARRRTTASEEERRRAGGN